jgi:hypothetical protein
MINFTRPWIYRARGLRLRLREAEKAKLREREGVSVVHAGQSKRPQFLGAYRVGGGVKVGVTLAVQLTVAVVVREASTNAQGVVTPRSEMHSDFLHMFANTEQVRSHLPVLLVRGAGDRFTSQDGIDFDNLDRVMQLTGRVRGTLLPPKDKDKK